MKSVKTIGIMLLISLLMQGGILYGMERWVAQALVVKGPSGSVAQGRWHEHTIEAPLKNARQIGISYDGQYMAWNEGDGYTVWDIQQGRQLYHENLIPGHKVALIQWLADRNRLILITEQSTAPVNLPPGAKPQDASRSAIQVMLQVMNNKPDLRSLPPSTSTKQMEISFMNADGSQRILSTRIRSLQSSDEVKEAIISPQANLLYLTLGDARFANTLYRVDIQHDAHRVPMRAARAEQLKVGSMQGSVYGEFWDLETSATPSIYQIKGMQTVPISTKPLNSLLLGLDRKNTLYLGQGQGRQIQSVYTWDGKQMQKERTLPSTVNRDHIMIGPNGQIAIIDEPESSLKIYTRGVDAPSTFKFEAGARPIKTESRFVGLLKPGDQKAQLWMLSF
ncbi:hypothetical protein [Heliophilum fasciatum]|uniref:Uncharacterized protein n=1 Tax=Heliophilum fasciatum TaxID=35700 RepID=A0A4R2RV52_9FIRM|nr:hypothetical protein [Heliophilum fasciatum]MCW2277382.1 hypothetical protein [Heliophilum fasciatum]TCP67218.1 hypothetical protein EDD73_105113 [Heliophilum fasciatum]